MIQTIAIETRPVRVGQPLALLDQVLDISCERLQLSSSLHTEAEGHYGAVGEWLGESPSLEIFRPRIYPQGSFAIGTTTKPRDDREYDVDLVFGLTFVPVRLEPLSLLDAVEARLRDHGVYRPMVERKKRCVRLRYADRFHLDILPAIPAGTGTTNVFVPDRELRDWTPSNPKGFVAWFKARSQLTEAMLKADIQALPAHETAGEKTTLQRVVQLLKRARDIYFAGREEREPRSIVLTTLAAQAYQGERSTARAFGAVLASIIRRASLTLAPLRVDNPTNPAERLSEVWDRDPPSYTEFLDWLAWLQQQWNRVFQPAGLTALCSNLTGLFGAADVVSEAVKLHVQKTEQERRAGNLYVNRAGTLITGAGVMAVRPNTFHGE